MFSLMPGGRISGASRIAMNSGGDHCGHGNVLRLMLRDSGIVHIRRCSHHGNLIGRNTKLAANKVVIRLDSQLRNVKVPLMMVIGLAALMIHEITKALALSAVFGRSAENTMRLQ
jgi:hypothetical protein